jgi:ketosteroid isomerase-like protein
MSTEATLSRHLQAFNEGVDSIMRDYTDESVLFTPDGPLSGLEDIRAFFDGFLRSSPPELIRALTLTRQDIRGDIAYIHWKAEPFIPFATDTFLIRDEKILMQSFAMLAPTPAEAAG